MSKKTKEQLLKIHLENFDKDTSRELDYLTGFDWDKLDYENIFHFVMDELPVNMDSLRYGLRHFIDRQTFEVSDQHIVLMFYTQHVLNGALIELERGK